MTTPQEHFRLFRAHVFSTTDRNWPAFEASELAIVPASIRGVWRTSKGDAQIEFGAVTADYTTDFATSDAEYTTHVFEARGGCDFDAASATFRINDAHLSLSQRPACGPGRTVSLGNATFSATYTLDGDCMHVTIKSDTSGAHECTWELRRHRAVIAAS